VIVLGRAELEASMKKLFGLTRAFPQDFEMGIIFKKTLWIFMVSFKGFFGRMDFQSISKIFSQERVICTPDPPPSGNAYGMTNATRSDWKYILCTLTL
jgi:hypothetical protein